jgi:membrane protein implicated in regulation of membrane protease activity
MLTEPQKSPGFAAVFCSVLGAISSVSWMFAAFVGVARLIAPVLNYQLFLELYGVALLVGLMVALLFVRPRLERMLIQQQGPADTAFDTDRQVEDERHSLAA